MERKTTRDQFYQVSLKLFYEKGFTATSMRDIAGRLDIQAATLYNYVSSKQEILDNFLFEIANKFHGGMTQISQSSYTPLEKLKSVIALNVRLTSENPYKVSMLVSEWKHLEAARRKEFLENRQGYESMLRSIISEGMEVRQFRQANLEIALQAILSSIRWMFTWYASEAQVPNPVELEKQMTDFVLSGMHNQEPHAMSS